MSSRRPSVRLKDLRSWTQERDHGQARVIRNEEALVLKPKCSEGASATPSVSVNGFSGVLKAIPVKSCRATSHGSVVVKFPRGEAKVEAKALVGSSADFVEVAVPEPKTMLSKNDTVGCSPSLPDSEIISGILDKNPQIEKLLNAGHTLTEKRRPS